MAIGRFGCNGEFTIRQAGIADLDAMARLALLLWPNHTFEELKEDMEETLFDKEAVFFLCFKGDLPIGFAQCQLRRDYVEGTKTTPVGYLEGVFVSENERRKGVAGQLLRQCELWAALQGCTEFASDCELANAQSAAFHAKSGFQEANRIVCFKKEIGPK